ncbi:MAG: hypothetical protein AAF658_03425 [Myxococcota bacterium]
MQSERYIALGSEPQWGRACDAVIARTRLLYGSRCERLVLELRPSSEEWLCEGQIVGPDGPVGSLRVSAATPVQLVERLFAQIEQRFAPEEPPAWVQLVPQGPQELENG